MAVDELFAVVRDRHPLSPGHTLIIARRPTSRFQQLVDTEKTRLLTWVDWAQRQLESTLSPRPDGFNLGVNDGAAAGQTIVQFHFHVMPRYFGDLPDPRGGVRWVIAARARYW